MYRLCSCEGLREFRPKENAVEGLKEFYLLLATTRGFLAPTRGFLAWYFLEKVKKNNKNTENIFIEVNGLDLFSLMVTGKGRKKIRNSNLLTAGSISDKWKVWQVKKLHFTCIESFGSHL